MSELGKVFSVSPPSISHPMWLGRFLTWAVSCAIAFLLGVIFTVIFHG